MLNNTEISYDKKYQHWYKNKMNQVQQVLAINVTKWIELEVAYGFASKEEALSEIKHLLSWLVSNELYETALILRNQIHDFIKTFSKPKIIEEIPTSPNPTNLV